MDSKYRIGSDERVLVQAEFSNIRFLLHFLLMVALIVVACVRSPYLNFFLAQLFSFIVKSNEDLVILKIVIVSLFVLLILADVLFKKNHTALIVTDRKVIIESIYLGVRVFSIKFSDIVEVGDSYHPFTLLRILYRIFSIGDEYRSVTIRIPNPIGGYVARYVKNYDDVVKAIETMRQGGEYITSNVVDSDSNNSNQPGENEEKEEKPTESLPWYITKT